jgi:hypothetical protein
LERRTYGADETAFLEAPCAQPDLALRFLGRSFGIKLITPPDALLPKSSEAGPRTNSKACEGSSAKIALCRRSFTTVWFPDDGYGEGT